MAWTNSRIFRATVADVWDNTTAVDLGTDVPKVALYDNSITPNQDVASASTAYAAGVWSATGGGTGTPQVYQAGQWAQAGVALGTTSLNSATAGVVFYDAADTASGAAATLSNVFGCLVYDDTLAAVVVDQGLCYNYFGGTNAVSGGTLTVVWHANGIFRWTFS
jgi:hypothetical protein